MSNALPVGVVQTLQVLTVLVCSPGLSGFIAHVEGRLQGRRGPRILQPYYDLGKLYRKETLVTDSASWVFVAAPFVAFVGYLSVPLLIPVLTSYPLPLGYQADILGGGFLLALAGFVTALAGADTGAPYAQMGSSRAMTFGALVEPTILFVVFTVAAVTATDLPYAEAATVRSAAGQIVRPGHLLAAAALFLAILADTGRIPVETHTSTLEFGMIDEGRTLEHSGPLFALFSHASMIKQMVLYTLLANVFLVPWGLSSTGSPGSVLLAIGALLGKAAVIGTVVALVDNSFAKLRLYKITEFCAAAFLLAVLALFTLFLGVS